MHTVTMAALTGGAALCGLCTPASGSHYPLPENVVAAYPTPGTIAASHRSQISFRGRPASELGTIRVSGSRSGRHTGRLVPHSDGRGASFFPSRPFRMGESVAVQTSLPIPRSRNGDFRFRVARFPGRVEIPKRILEPIPPGKRARYRSRRDLAPPFVTVSSHAGKTEPGVIALSPKSKTDQAQAGPMLVNNRGRIIYFRPLPGITAATDVRIQRYRGRPVLTWWEGTSRQGIGVGRLVIVDDTYRTIKRFQVPNGYKADLHEFLITPHDTAVIIAYPAVRANLAGIGGARNGQVIDSVIQEIDIATGAVIFEWHSLGNVRISDAFTEPVPSPNVPFDYFHANSAEVDTDGDFLISARSTWGVYKVDRTTGRVEWTLGGKRNDFRRGPGTAFAWQHDARRRADGALTLFDNSAFPPVRKRSRAIALRLDEEDKIARLVSSRVHPRGLLAATQGNYQTLPGGNGLVGWGSQRYFTEYDRSGKVVWDARLSIGYETYRAYRAPWVGQPFTKPSLAAVRHAGGSVDIYASWNGSTETVSWEFLAGPSPSELRPVATANRVAFETRVRVRTGARYFAARARNAAGEVIGTSPTRRSSSG